MTREQKAMAAYGSVLAVGLLLLWRWSVPGGLLLLVLGLAAVTAALRLTNPHRFAPPAPRAPARPAPRPGQPSPYFGQDQGDQRAELARRRQAATARTQQRQGGPQR